MGRNRRVWEGTGNLTGGHIRSYIESRPEVDVSASISARRASMVKWLVSVREPAEPFSAEGARSRDLGWSIDESSLFSFSGPAVTWERSGASDRGITTPGKFWRSLLKGLKVRKPMVLVVSGALEMQ